MTLENCQNWICPDLRSHWQLVRIQNADQYILRSIREPIRLVFSVSEGYALRYFIGRFTVQQVQELCQQELDEVSPTLVVDLIKKLIERNILSLVEIDEQTSSTANPLAQYQLQLIVQWFRHPNEP
ncbi:hypothetical protein [Pantanalinema sp. GBBB05]|uniref:hypothetical protein n=1 Tax=Pantanalinema sp. GBBB05 TaxID=2604139 RepID=UPI001D58566D|nr:hypothetical protein [Pantanalinema sp. GBBB05]